MTALVLDDRGTPADAVALLVNAHREGQKLKRLPEPCRPRTIEEAYAIQDATVRSLGSIGGWKVGRAGSNEPRCAPVPKHRVFEAGVTLDPQFFSDASLEVEFAYRLRTALLPRAQAYCVEEIVAAVDLVPLIEVVGTRFLADEELDPLEKLADLQANAAFVVGPAAADWPMIDVAATTVELSIDGKLMQQARGPHFSGHPLVLVAWLANHAMARSGGLKRGDIVTTGSLQGMTPIAAKSHAIGIWREWGRIELSVGPI